jgi:adenine-specific DNA-methyltransferase
MVGKSEIKKRKLEQYDHKGKERVNNPPVGLVNPETDKDWPNKKYQYDPHLDPQLIWTGKAEHTAFEVPTVSLHVHERIDPRTIIEAVKKKNGDNHQPSLFSSLEENPPLCEAVDFYKHKHNWSNRLIAGDSLLIMNSLLEKEGMSGKIQMIYMDPPYGIKYGSNFQPFVNKRDVKDGKDEDLTSEPEMIKAFRDTWELGIHSYLTYMRDRLLLAKELLSESGSVFVQISDENVHHIKELMDEVFGSKNFVSIINFQKTGGLPGKLLQRTVDYIIWYCKDKEKIKYRQLFLKREIGDTSLDRYDSIELEDGNNRRLTKNELLGIEPLPRGKRFRAVSLFSQGENEKSRFEFEFQGIKQKPIPGRSWATGIEGLGKLKRVGRLILEGGTIRYKRYADDFPYIPLVERWESIQIGTVLNYVVQTATKVLERCILMTTDPGDLVLDPTCGSGTTAYVAEQWGRRWITCDTSRVAVTLAKQRIMTAVYGYYQLAHPEEGVESGFVYKTVPHIKLKSIANNESPAQETLYDQPLIDKSKARVTGPFTVEAVPSPVSKSLDEIDNIGASDISVARSGETLHQSEWRDELLNNGVRGKAGQYIKFSRIEPLSGTRYIQAEGETKEDGGDKRQRVFVVFGPEYAPMESKQVELALEEAQSLRPKADIILFAAFQFDPEAAKDIDEINWPGVSLLRIQMNADLFTDDLKKKRTSNDSFWLLGQPDVSVIKIEEGEHKDRKGMPFLFQVEVKGFDYYDTKTGNVVSGGENRIAMWMLDTNYDGRSLFPRQVFFPMASETEGWSKLAKNLKAEIDQELIEAYRGTVSLPFSAGGYKRCAVKIIDDRGIESLRIINL